MKDDPIREALHQTLLGLDAMLLDRPLFEPGHPEETSFQHLQWMIDHATKMNFDWPVDKTSRWVGFVQGVLAMRGILDVKAERGRTRPFFHEAYAAMGLKVP